MTTGIRRFISMVLHPPILFIAGSIPALALGLAGATTWLLTYTAIAVVGLFKIPSGFFPAPGGSSRSYFPRARKNNGKDVS